MIKELNEKREEVGLGIDIEKTKIISNGDKKIEIKIDNQSVNRVRRRIGVSGTNDNHEQLGRQGSGSKDCLEIEVILVVKTLFRGTFQ